MQAGFAGGLEPGAIGGAAQAIAGMTERASDALATPPPGMETIDARPVIVGGCAGFSACQSEPSHVQVSVNTRGLTGTGACGAMTDGLQVGGALPCPAGWTHTPLAVPALTLALQAIETPGTPPCCSVLVVQPLPAGSAEPKLP